MKRTEDDIAWTALAVAVTLCAILCGIGFCLLCYIT